MKKITQSKSLKNKNNNKSKKVRMRLKKHKENAKPKQHIAQRRGRKLNHKKRLSNNLSNSPSTIASNNVVKSQPETKKKQINPQIPWLTEDDHRLKGAYRLHHEILDFYDYISPKKSENDLRLQTIKEIKAIIKKRWPTWKIKTFGSFPNKLHLSNSDIDLVVFKDKSLNFSTEHFSKYDFLMSDNEQLTEIYKTILNSGFAKHMRFVDARVPIVKVTAKNGINFDISY
jgi:DNA polymerase sigma